MMHTRFYRRAGLSLVLVLTLMLQVSLAADSQPSEAARPLERITVVDAGDRVRVEIDSGRAAAYSMSTSEAPASVTVDLPGLSKGAGLQRMDVNKPPLLQVIPSEVLQPKPGVQLSFMLTAAVKPDIRTEGTRLIIDFQKVQAGAEIAGQAQGQSDNGTGGGVQKAASSTEQSAGQAKIMSKVEGSSCGRFVACRVSAQIPDSSS